MKLSNIEIKGFKSFADKTVINFNESITGVVGPNGCGKSNIVDAVRWVIGEQKASSLRSEKMTNLIFAGTKRRKSSGLAEVSLTFENTKNLLPTDYSTVKISRLYFKNGDSEYRLNGVPCRLKDITNLFIDTGISSDSYAIMELAMIGDILNDKDNSRRKLFEQAAGISKYKQRKKETLNKLAATETDLDRVQDLLYEIEGNLKSLERQAKRAERYKKLKTDYKEASIQLAIHLLEGQKTLYKELSEKETTEKDRKLELETSIKELEAKLEKERSGNIENEQLLAAAQKALNDSVGSIKSTENDKNLAIQGKTFSEKRKEEIEQQRKRSEGDIETLNSEIGELKTEEETCKELLDQVKEVLLELGDQQNAAQQAYDEAREALEGKQMIAKELERKVFEHEKQLAVNQSRIDYFNQNAEQTKEELDSMRKDLDEVSRELEQAEAAKNTKERELNDYQTRTTEIKNRIEQLSNGLDQVSRELTEVNRKLDSRRNEYNLTKSLVENMEGYPESIKFLRKEVQWTKQAPLLSDIISCKEDYKVAIENYLHPYLNHYVVRNTSEAIRAIQALNSSAKGRANFFVLDELSQVHNRVDLSLPNSIPALQVLDIDPRYNQLANFLLGNVYIIDDSESFDADAFSNLNASNATVLTKSGRFIRSNYSLSGGSVGLFEGKKLGRAKNLEKLSVEIKELERRSEELEERKKKFEADLSSSKSSIDEEKLERLQSEFNQVNSKFVSLQTKYENLGGYLTGNTDKSAMNQNKLQEFEAAIVQLTGELDGWRKEHAEAAEVLEKYQEEFNAASAALTKINKEFNEKNIELHRQQNQFNSIAQSIDFKSNQLSNLKTEIQTGELQIGHLISEISGKTEEISNLEIKLGSLYDQRDQLQNDLQKAEEVYYKSRGSISEIEEELRNTQRLLSNTDLIINEVREKFTELKLQLGSIKERLQIEFNVDINDLMDLEPQEGTNHEELNEKVEKLKKRLDNYGEVNPTAMEAYEVMKKRFDFITEQKDDLDEARKSLMKTIDEIEETAKNKFMEAFDKIRDNFIEVFRGLFSEDDTCDLKLINPEEPLESKIEIIAKPKGKRPQTINQLSGGEKTLTAMSLLFAIYLLKPAPFCILDEVDAPLDDHNIDKFNSIVKKFAKDSQFIIVTHNKQTMAAVDVIYGITMAEEGVSRVVPVDFRNLN